MASPIIISETSATPKYIQISDSIIEFINQGLLEKGSKLPSINEISATNHLARETVVKAFTRLKKKGLVSSIHGKGYYVSSTNTKTTNRVFVLLDTFTSYKETLYFGMKDAFGAETFLDLYFHHFNFDVFSGLIAHHIGDYQSYIILPINHKKISEALAPVPYEKLFLIDIKPNHLQGDFIGIYQDFENDVIDALTSISELITRYSSLNLVFRNTITEVPKSLERGFRRYCEKNGIHHQVLYERVHTNIKSGEAFMVIDDEDLVRIVEAALEHGLKIGKDIGIISYNETPLKKVVGTGISVISTDFYSMGEQIAEMVKNNIKVQKRNKTTFVNRGSF